MSSVIFLAIFDTSFTSKLSTFLKKSAGEIERFKNLSGVVDAVYNPLRSKLVSDALNRNIKAVGGLYMLVAQAAFAVEYFIDTKIEKDRIESVFNALFKRKENIDYLRRNSIIIFIDDDPLILKEVGTTSKDVILLKDTALVD